MKFKHCIIVFYIYFETDMKIFLNLYITKGRFKQIIRKYSQSRIISAQIYIIYFNWML